MTQESDVSLLVEHTGVVAVVSGVGVAVAAVGSYVVALASLAYVAVYDNFAVNDNGDVVALHADFLAAPLAQRLVLDALCGDYAVN